MKIGVWQKYFSFKKFQLSGPNCFAVHHYSHLVREGIFKENVSILNIFNKL